MNTTFSFFIVFVACLSFFTAAPFSAAAVPPPAPDCQQLADTLIASPAWQDGLQAPDIENAAGLPQDIQRYSTILTCIREKKVSATAQVEKLAADIELFLVFSGQWQAPDQTRAQFSLIHLKDVANTAVAQMRTAQIPLPSDDRVLVWRFFSRDYLPPELLSYFHEGVAGVSFHEHYVAYIDISPFYNTDLKKDVEEKALATLSHELVHAYTKQSMESKPVTMPLWFSEGLAIYFSNSGEPLLKRSQDGSERYTFLSTPDYVQYRDNFTYLENRYGREKLVSLIRQSLAEGNPDLLLRQTGLQSAADLAAHANDWLCQNRFIRLGWGLGGVIGLIAAGWGLVRFSPFGLVRIWLGDVRGEEDVERLAKHGSTGGLIRALQHQDHENPQAAVRIRRRAAQALETFSGDHVVRALIRALEDPDSEVRDLAAHALGKPGSSAAVEPLLALAAHHPRAALAALQIIGDHRAVAPLLRQVWIGQPARLNLPVVEALHTWHEQHNLQAEIASALDDPDPLLRAGAAYLTGFTRLTSFSQHLLPLLDDPSALVQAAAWRGMARLQTPAARACLTERLLVCAAPLQEQIIQALSAEEYRLMGEILRGAYPALRSAGARWAIITTLRQHDLPAALPLLLEMLAAPEEQPRVVEILATLRDPHAVPALLQAESHPGLPTALRARLIVTLAVLGDNRLLSKLLTDLYAPEDPICRAASLALAVLSQREQFCAEDVQSLIPHVGRINELL